MEMRPRVPPALDHVAALAWRLLVCGVALAVLVVVAVRLRLVVIPAVLALFGAALFAPPAGALRRVGVPAGPSTALSMLGALAVLVGVGILLAPSVGQEFADLGPVVQEGISDVQDWLEEGPLNLSAQRIDEVIEGAQEWVRENTSQLTSRALSGAALAAEVFAGFVLTAVLVFFYVKDGDRITDWIIGHVPEHNREVVRALGRRSWEVLGSYLRGTALVGLVDAVFIGIGLVLVGVPLVIPLMLLTFVAAFLPLVGATLAGIVAALVALVSGGFVDALIVGAIVLAVQQVEGNLLQPFVMGRAMSLHPIVILLALTAGAVLAGIIGAFFAVPIVAVAAAAGKELRVRGLFGTPPDAERPSDDGAEAGAS